MSEIETQLLLFDTTSDQARYTLTERFNPDNFYALEDLVITSSRYMHTENDQLSVILDFYTPIIARELTDRYGLIERASVEESIINGSHIAYLALRTEAQHQNRQMPVFDGETWINFFYSNSHIDDVVPSLNHFFSVAYEDTNLSKILLGYQQEAASQTTTPFYFYGAGLVRSAIKYAHEVPELERQFRRRPIPNRKRNT